LDPKCMRFSEHLRQLICKHDKDCYKPHEPPLQPYDVCEECFKERLEQNG
jgi:hypothetical protein